MSEETLRDLIALTHKLNDAYNEIDALKAEAKRREEIWLGRLQAADRRAEYILRRTVNRFTESPVIIIDKADLPKMSMDPGAVITYGEWPKTERAIIEHGTVYFRDFLRSFWKRLTGRRAA